MMVDTLPYTELVHIHNCLRQEVGELRTRVIQLGKSAGNQQLWPKALGELLHQFDFFYVVYHSHSKAEDDVIIPALVRKGLAPQAEKEIRDEHSGHGKVFEEIRIILLHLRGQNVFGLSSECTNELRRLLEHLADLVDRVNSSVFLHLKKEEEELFPLLTQHFAQGELEFLAGNILGNRSSELVNCYLEMIIRDLPEQEKVRAIESIKTTAEGTRFSNWLEHIGVEGQRRRQQNAIIGATKRTDIDGASVCFHRCPEVGVCCSAQDSANPKILGCSHYKRKCKLLFPCCNQLHCCRICHDEAVTEQAFMGNSQGRIVRHQANRYQVEKMWCMNCSTFQPVGKYCLGCKVEMASFFCGICNLFDDGEHRPIYHCPFCNVCRIGKGLGEDYTHCMKCNACIRNNIKDHKCIDHSLESDCPICLQGMFDATKPVQAMKCGHFMHRDCFNSYVTHNFKCPTCRKSVNDMGMVWKKIDQIWEHLLNQDQISKLTIAVPIHCDDCQKDCTWQRLSQLPDTFENLPNKCACCGSYNTFCK